MAKKKDGRDRVIQDLVQRVQRLERRARRLTRRVRRLERRLARARARRPTMRQRFEELRAERPEGGVRWPGPEAPRPGPTRPEGPGWPGPETPRPGPPGPGGWWRWRKASAPGPVIGVEVPLETDDPTSPLWATVTARLPEVIPVVEQSGEVTFYRYSAVGSTVQAPRYRRVSGDSPRPPSSGNGVPQNLG